jgi:hypothetical protein
MELKIKMAPTIIIASPKGMGRIKTGNPSKQTKRPKKKRIHLGMAYMRQQIRIYIG